MARPRKFQEHDVLLAARAQFWHQGYDGTSMAELCTATGVASQSLYGAFGSKHGLFLRTLEAYCTQQVDGLRAAYERASSPWSWLMAAVTFEDGGRIGLTSDGCYLSSSASALARIDADVHTTSRQTYEHISALFAVAIADGQGRGEIRTDVDAKQMALAMVAAMQGIEFLRKSGLDDDAFATAKAGVTGGLRLAYAAGSVGAAPVGADATSADTVSTDTVSGTLR